MTSETVTDLARMHADTLRTSSMLQIQSFASLVATRYHDGMGEAETRAFADLAKAISDVLKMQSPPEKP